MDHPGGVAVHQLDVYPIDKQELRPNVSRDRQPTGPSTPHAVEREDSAERQHQDADPNGEVGRRAGPEGRYRRRWTAARRCKKPSSQHQPPRPRSSPHAGAVRAWSSLSLRQKRPVGRPGEDKSGPGKEREGRVVAGRAQVPLEPDRQHVHPCGLPDERRHHRERRRQQPARDRRRAGGVSRNAPDEPGQRPSPGP